MKLPALFKNPLILAAASAVLLRLSYPKFNIWFLAWLAFIPLFLAIERQNATKTFIISFFSGTLFFILTIFWLVHVTVPGMIVLSTYLGFYVVFFALGYQFLKERIHFWQRLILLPSLWVFLEYIRGHFLTGFPWALLACSQTYNLVALQAADVFGAYGVSFIVMFANVYFLELIKNYKKKIPLSRRCVYVPALILLVWFVYGCFRMAARVPERRSLLKVAIIQGNISQEIKWIAGLRQEIFKKYQLLTEIVNLKEEPDLIIWPETSLPDYLELGHNDQPLKEFIATVRTPILVGSIRFQNMHFFNSALLFSSSGELWGVYDKIHLVPFGEYIPLRQFLPFAETILPIEDFTPGAQYKIFSINDHSSSPVKFGVLICFEDIFSDLARRFVESGADFLVNITNDAWFGDTSSPYQHMQASVLRAVENRVFVVRAANTGISCIIDDVGRVSSVVKGQSGKETFVTGYEAGFIARPIHRSLYTHIGDIFAVLCSLYAMAMLFLYSSRLRRMV